MDCDCCIKWISADFLQQWRHIWHLLLSSIKDFFWSSLSRESIVLLDFGVLIRQSINVATEIATRFKKNLEGENRRSGTGGAMLGGDLGSESASLLKSRIYLIVHVSTGLLNLSWQILKENSPSSVAAHLARKALVSLWSWTNALSQTVDFFVVTILYFSNCTSSTFSKSWKTAKIVTALIVGFIWQQDLVNV